MLQNSENFNLKCFWAWTLNDADIHLILSVWLFTSSSSSYSPFSRFLSLSFKAHKKYNFVWKSNKYFCVSYTYRCNCKAYTHNFNMKSLSCTLFDCWIFSLLFDFFQHLLSQQTANYWMSTHIAASDIEHTW